MNLILQKQGDSRGCAILLTVVKVTAIIVIILLPSLLSAASLRLDGERAWLKADGLPLAEVLQLFEQRGVEVLVEPSLTEKIISGNWQNIKVDRLITQLVSPHSNMLEWQKVKGPLGDGFKISSIRIFSKGKANNVQPLSSGQKVLDVVDGENGVKYIRGEIMVGFDQNSSIEDLNMLLEKLNGTVIEAIVPPGIYRIKLNDNVSVEEAMRIAQKHDNVKATEPNLAMPTIDSNTYPSTAIGEGINLNLDPDETETAIAVFDSGLDPAYADYPFIQGTYDALDPTAEISDPSGHGTLTTLIAAGAITPLGAQASEGGVPVYSIRAFDENGLTSSDTIMRALQYAGNAGVKIISMSWGSEIRSEFLEATMNFAAANGIKLYAAAGNKPTGIPVYPAGYDSVIAVGGLNPDGTQWEDSNYGEFVEHFEPAMANFNDRTHAGTSIATPYAAFKSAQEID